MDVQIDRITTSKLLEQLRDWQKLSPAESTVLEALAVMRGRFVSRERLATILYGDREDGGPEWAKAIIGTYVHNIREKLPGLNIETQYHWGYRLAC